MGNAASYMACDVSIKNKGLNADTHGHYKYRELKKHIILIIKLNHSIRAFLKSRCSVRIQKIPNKTWMMLCTFKKMSTILESFYETS